MAAFSLMLPVDSLKLIATVRAEDTNKILGGQSCVPPSPHHFPPLCRKSAFLQSRKQQVRTRDACWKTGNYTLTAYLNNKSHLSDLGNNLLSDRIFYFFLFFFRTCKKASDFYFFFHRPGFNMRIITICDQEGQIWKKSKSSYMVTSPPIIFNENFALLFLVSSQQNPICSVY